MYYLAPSILSADFAVLGQQIQEIEKAGADLLHIDVMDGSFVPQISYGMPVIRSIRKITQMPFDVHLMVEEPIRFIEDFKNCGADMITVHYEACKHLYTTILKIKELGMKAGVALNPATPVSVLEEILPELDYVLIMTVNPGYGGQKFLENMVDKVRRMRKMATDKGLNPDIEVDGGISKDNVAVIMEAGANMIVAGSAVFGDNMQEKVKGFKEVFANADR